MIPKIIRVNSLIFLAVAILLLAAPVALSAADPYPWPKKETRAETLSARIPPPPGFTRLAAKEGSFAAWLRGLPLRPEGTPVRLYDGGRKWRGGVAFAVIDIDVGSKDLQQCADAVMRLRAEYLRASGCADRISFNFTSGHPARWADWAKGKRPQINGNRVSWAVKSRPDSSYGTFRGYLDTVFTYAGSKSLSLELDKVKDPAQILPGDVFIEGGFPGHAVIVADVAQNKQGRRAFLLLQSYMPAQDIHLLKNPSDSKSPWYPALSGGTLETPEWTFTYSDLRRFPETDCKAGLVK
ncbi:MAG: DUF4846 domain-containing protein [Deltaproteobacteria bacterium]|nr:DUF4846 domain-containing protein [Deltaproteobacteria bacterium]